MALFRRATRGRHALGAAVTSIPSGPLQMLVAARAAPAPAVVEAHTPPESTWHRPAAEPHVMASIAELIATGKAWSTEPPPPPAWRMPRVQLGFRDGSSTSLDPSSSQSRALQALARSLTRRD